MKSIITLTFNPAIDKSTSVERVLPDKKLRCGKPHFEPGGGGVNVARVLKRFGHDVTALFPSGGHTGNFFCKMLESEAVKYMSIPTDGYTRENLIVLETSTGHQYRFGMPGSGFSQAEWKQCLQTLSDMDKPEYLIVSGSLPPGTDPSVMSDVADYARDSGSKLIADSSGKSLEYAVNAGVFMFKPNLGELASLAGKEWLEDDDIPGICRDLIDNGKAVMIAVSMAEKGAMLISSDLILKAMPPQVEKRSTVGAGDSMVAGMMHALLAGKTMEEVLAYGVASGTAATMNPGTELCKPADVEKLVPLVKISRS